MLILDGAMGTQIQATRIPERSWRGKRGCNEILNLTAPEVIRGIHAAYFAAGSDAVETNTFGASGLVLAEYGLAGQTREINRAAALLAREAVRGASGKARYVLGSLGPGTKLPSLGQVSFDELRESYLPQLEGLLEGGVDGIIVETCQDPLQIKAVLDAFRAVGGEDPEPVLYVSFTIETTGSMLVGTSIPAVVAALEAYPIDILGLNCALGPTGMRPHLEYLRRKWSRRTACMPNAGMPELRDGRTVYPLEPEEFARRLGTIVRECSLDSAGGCCGTGPAHIAALVEELRGYRPSGVLISGETEAVASLYEEVALTQEPRPLYIGERGNATGSKKFRDALLADDFDRGLEIMKSQEDLGVHLLDLSCAYAGRDEVRDLPILTAMAARECRAPLVIDSTIPAAVEAALKHYGGRAVINSVNLEEGEEKARRVVSLARRFGAALICLCIDENGMARSVAEKLATARRLVALCEKGGMERGSLLVDPLTFSIASGDPALADSARTTAAAIGEIKRALPGVRTVIGLSNVSFGLRGEARSALNAIFLDRCLGQGLDACIVNIAAFQALPEVPGEVRELGRRLLDNDTAHGDPLENYLARFSGSAPSDSGSDREPDDPSERLRRLIVRGRTVGLAETVDELCRSIAPEKVLNRIMVPSMQEVGRLFNEGTLQLPFVLKSAEVMKAAVDKLQPHFAGSRPRSRRVLVLATVAGDVHDIGKNLVKIILSNNGIDVIDLGTRVPAEKIIEAIREYSPQAVGMSGLLVKSVATMVENLKALAAAGISTPVLLGGAALTPEFVRDSCQPEYPGPVVYCRDAFDSLAYLERGAVPSPRRPHLPSPRPPDRLEIAPPPSAPAAPFTGSRVVKGVDLSALIARMNRRRLMVSRWKFQRGTLGAEEYRRLLKEEAEPILEELLARVERGRLLKAGAVYGYYPCRSQGDDLAIAAGDFGEVRLTFPRQEGEEGAALPDFFRSDSDVVGFMGVSVASPDPNVAVEEGKYRDYFLLHGLAAEMTEVLAGWVQEQMMRELFPSPEGGARRGERYAFGYPAAPDMMMNRTVCSLLGSERAGIRALENGMLVPDTSIVALVAHHPQARYFRIEPGRAGQPQQGHGGPPPRKDG
ncbi:MAG TPA: homocysteine S-methyltransferase family protein [bacterium]|nr:homocysteine S-methyltransferase family protein [bacterium]HPQ66147.1 homocysteine S-methyltransferase family protein [bacterium]